MRGLALAFYSLVMWLAQPLLRAKLAQRAKQEPMYAQDMAERFGYYETPVSAVPTAPTGLVWVHAVSLGETRAAVILIAQLRDLLPGMRLLLTHGTATGRAEGAKLLQASDVQAWLPWDTQGAVQRFLEHFKPRIGIVMETEVWPNLCAKARRSGVPLVLANARLNERSTRSAQRMAWIARPAYAAFTQVWAQTPEDAVRLQAVGAQHVSVQGNVKYDATIDATMVQRGRAWRAAGACPVIMLASSRDGEEVLFLEQLKEQTLTNITQAAMEFAAPKVQDPNTPQAVMPPPPNVQWMIVPRHPQRFDEVAQLITQAGFSLSRRSEWGAQPTPADVWLGDTLGEMALYYGLADVALLGGSFAPLGGQNLIEAIAAGCPVVMGPHTFNFADAADTAQAQGAAVREPTMGAAVQAARAIVTDSAWHTVMRSAGEHWLSTSRGATQRMTHALVKMLQIP
jgi:3-deoxy-D-manno-octulosonic-acid transferase